MKASRSTMSSRSHARDSIRQMLLLVLLQAAFWSANSLSVPRPRQVVERRQGALYQRYYDVSNGAVRSSLLHSRIENDEKDNSESDGSSPYDSAPVKSLEQAMESRYACKAFRRSDGSERSLDTASVSDPQTIETARTCLDLARLAPSAFNTQPYRIVLVHSTEQKRALAQSCLGPNQQRVLDADCTAVFLADRQILKSARQFASFSQQIDRKNRALPKIVLLYLAIFSSGFPLPRVLSSVTSFCMRMGVGIVDWFTRKILRKCFLPSLSSAETWASKQATMVAMAYMISCASRGLDTIPMEGVNASCVRRALNIKPQGRYAIPLIVATGTAEKVRHGGDVNARRYETNSVVFENSFGNTVVATRITDRQ